MSINDRFIEYAAPQILEKGVIGFFFPYILLFVILPLTILMIVVMLRAANGLDKELKRIKSRESEQ